MVRTLPFHGKDTGSIPVRDIYMVKKIKLFFQSIVSTGNTFFKLFGIDSKHYYLIMLSIISVLFLVFLSPIFGIVWLVVPTFYFLWRKQYTKVFFIWSFFFFYWYLFFTICLLDFNGPIWIGGYDSQIMVDFVMLKYTRNTLTPFWYRPYLRGFCFQTIFFLDMLSSFLGVSIYIPSLVKVLLTILKFIGKYRN